ncbi:ketopantoate reductase family protein [Mycetocola tolaasinivorans]|uniref:2-dehydropantoate 2-reductase n=1 Tax=Mycetocola tolaasinivorans TaxID=76635 RepID=A0A3L7AC09_9MICO|nr:ketopantoate reductase family protein [Mycetocola tolaasinivorans]RLP77939.1 ketopantoate reductase family protein [Mycetocola tolaasinivorans]
MTTFPARILIVGAGATGGYFGTRLLEAGRDVTFLLREARAARVREHGLRVRALDGEFVSHPAVLTSQELSAAAPFDLVLLGVRADALEAALEDLAPAVGPDTVIIPFLNGTRHLEVLRTRFAEAHVFGGVAKVSTSLDAEGTIVQVTPGASIDFGALRPDADAVTRTLALLSVPGITVSSREDIIQDMWDKWVFIVSLTSITALMGAPIGAVASTREGTEFARAVVDEAATVSAAAGHPVSIRFHETLTATATDPSSPMTTSVYRSMRAGVPSEVEAMLGTFQATARELGIDTPRIDLATLRLRVHEHVIAQQRA